MERQKKKQKGITLIALVISIIVMLILAGVSLNMTIGENGIISQAQDATLQSGIAVLEEYLQQQYVKFYDYSDDYMNKPELLAAKMPNLFLKDGTKNYITADGKMYYLINKSILPNDIKSSLKAGDTSDYGNYIRLKDVYGVTTDLKVYYYDINGLEGGNVFGTTEVLEFDPNTPVALVNSNEGLKDTLTEALEEIGITVGENGITAGNINALKTLTIDGKKHNIANLNGLSELRSLRTLNLLNLKVDNLNGIESCGLLNSLYFENCDINDYTKLAGVYGLNKLYFRFLNSMDIEKSNNQVKKIALSLEKASSISNLQYFGIFGVLDCNEKPYGYNKQYSEDYKYSYNSASNISNVTDISALSKVSPNIKNSIKYMFLNHNNLGNIDCLSNFTNLLELNVMFNLKLTSFNGLQNHSNLLYLMAQYTGITQTDELAGCTKLSVISIHNAKLESLRGINSLNLKQIYAQKNSIRDISALNSSTNITYLDLENNDNAMLNSGLEIIEPITKCDSITSLYLLGNTHLDTNVLSTEKFQKIIRQCGNNYSLEGMYGLLFLDKNSINLEKNGLTDSDLALLKATETNGYASSINALNLSENANLNNEKLNEIISTLTGLRSLKLKNVTGLTSISFMNNLVNLKELDLRGTSVTDLSVLENLANQNKLNLGALIIDNQQINLSSIQKAISVISENGKNKGGAGIYSFNKQNDVEGTTPAGFIAIGKKLVDKFSTCTNITSFYSYNSRSENFQAPYAEFTVLDLSNNPKLKYICVRWQNVQVKLPPSCETYHCYDSSRVPDLTNSQNLKNIVIAYGAGVGDSLKNLTTTKLTSFSINGGNWESNPNLNFLALNPNLNSVNFNSQRNISGFNVTHKISNILTLHCTSCVSLSNIDNLSYFDKLETVNLNNTKIQSLYGLQQHFNLRYLNVSDSLVNTLEDLNNDTNLETIYASNCRISSLKGIEKLEKLKQLNVSNNSISDLYYLNELLNNIGENNFSCDINLSGNSLQDNVPISITKDNGEVVNISSFSNVDVIKRLLSKGCTVNISSNAFNETTINELSKLGGITVK